MLISATYIDNAFVNFDFSWQKNVKIWRMMANNSISVFAPSVKFSVDGNTCRNRFLGVNVNEVHVLD